MQLPDFEEMAVASEEIADLSEAKALLEIDIKMGECKVFQRTQVEEKYFIGGKPASATFIENAYKYTGLDNELVPKRLDLARMSAQLELARSKLDLMKSRIEVWRSEQANQRISLTS